MNHKANLTYTSEIREPREKPVSLPSEAYVAGCHKKLLGPNGTPDHMIDRLLRLQQVLEVIPVSPSTWWKGVREGRFPKPVKLGPRTTCWRESEVVALCKESK